MRGGHAAPAEPVQWVRGCRHCASASPRRPRSAYTGVPSTWVDGPGEAMVGYNAVVGRCHFLWDVLRRTVISGGCISRLAGSHSEEEEVLGSGWCACVSAASLADTTVCVLAHRMQWTLSCQTSSRTVTEKAQCCWECYICVSVSIPAEVVVELNVLSGGKREVNFASGHWADASVSLVLGNTNSVDYPRWRQA